MQSLNISESGFGYIFKCIGLYYEGNFYFLLYLAALAFIFIKGGRRMKEVFIPQFIAMVLTVYNPLFPVALNSLFDVNKEYYRFLWMAPVVIAMSAVSVMLITGYTKDMIRGCGLFLFIACVFIACGSFLYKEGYIISPNIYHMPTEIPEVSRIIHEDSDREYPRALFEYDYNMLIRQYDGRILLSCDREAYLNAISGNLDYMKAMESEDDQDRLLAAIALNIRLPEDVFKESLERTDTEYVVVTTGNEITGYLKGLGFKEVGRTANHTVLHYDLKEEPEFELADYSEVWSLGPQLYDRLI